MSETHVLCAEGKGQANKMSDLISRGVVGTMQQFQDKLPRLPIPDLPQSLNRYLAAITPIVSKERLEQTKKLVAEFGKPEGVGERLQAMLKGRARTRDSWLADWWLQHNFLADRSSTLLYETGGALHPVRFHPRTKEMQLQVASKVLSLLLDVKELIDSRSLVVKEFSKNPQCTELFFNLFGTCRQPAIPCDIIQRYAPHETQHVVVAHNGQLFKLLVYHSSGKHLSSKQLFVQLQRIVKASPEMSIPPRDERVNLLTAEQRDTWATAFTELCQVDDENAKSLKAVQSAAVYLALDSGLPELVSLNATDKLITDEYDAVFIKRMLTGGGVDCNSANRWFDKSMQFMVSEDGTVSGLMEHAAMDSTAAVLLQNHVISELRSNTQDADDLDLDDLPPFQRLKWTFTPSLRQAILRAGEDIDKKVARLSMCSETFDKVGRTTVKPYKVSMDSFFQMAMQLTYFRMHRHTPSTHQGCSMWQFKLGRTDTIHSASVELDVFVQSVDDTAVSAAGGQGFNSHFFGLRQMAVDSGMPVPEIFTNETYVQSRRFTLHTSQVATPHALRIGFAPFRSVNGYGVSYTLLPDCVLFIVSSYNDSDHTDCARFASTLQRSLADMKDLLPHIPITSTL